MHPKLLQANLAFTRGEYAESRRYLREYRQLFPDGGDHLPLLLWLEAQTHPDRETRLRRLHELIAKTDDVQNPYAKLAREALAQEERYALSTPDSARPQKPRWTPFRIFLGGLLGLALFVGMFLLIPRPDDTLTEPTLTPTQDVSLTRTPPPDNSRPLVMDSYTARYDGGILQIIAYEERSARVISRESGIQKEAVPGAQFYALQVLFECRTSICDAPPQAELALLLDSGESLPARTDLAILGDTGLQAIALGRNTRGWIVFESPLVNAVSALLVTPILPNNQRAETLTISLPLGE